MLALLHDVAVLHHKDHVRLADGGETMGYQKGGAVRQQMVNGVLDQLLRLGVDGGGGLIQHEDAGVGQYGTGKGDQLLLAGGETVAALPHIAVPAIFQL